MLKTSNTFLSCGSLWFFWFSALMPTSLKLFCTDWRSFIFAVNFGIKVWNKLWYFVLSSSYTNKNWNLLNFWNSCAIEIKLFSLIRYSIQFKSRSVFNKTFFRKQNFRWNKLIFPYLSHSFLNFQIPINLKSVERV